MVVGRDEERPGSTARLRTSSPSKPPSSGSAVEQQEVGRLSWWLGASAVTHSPTTSKRGATHELAELIARQGRRPTTPRIVPQSRHLSENLVPARRGRDSRLERSPARPRERKAYRMDTAGALRAGKFGPKWAGRDRKTAIFGFEGSAWRRGAFGMSSSRTAAAGLAAVRGDSPRRKLASAPRVASRDLAKQRRSVDREAPPVVPDTIRSVPLFCFAESRCGRRGGGAMAWRMRSHDGRR